MSEPLLLFAQIAGLQATHYTLLSLLVPPLLAVFADPLSLSLEGGAWNVAMVMDWREYTGRSALEEHIGALTSLPAGWGRAGSGRRVSSAAALENRLAIEGQAYGQDRARGWLLGFAWLTVCMLDIVYLFYLVRRPTFILDFCMTLVGIHLILTTYYASSFPTSFWFWLIIGLSAIIQIVWAEQLCIRREMRDGFQVMPSSDAGERRRSESSNAIKMSLYESVAPHEQP